jgi:hypothetical protein
MPATKILQTFAAGIKACPSQDPELRIETDMHIPSIKQLGVDRGRTIAATRVEDKRAGHVVARQTPVANFARIEQGNIYALAVSPDARWIAAEGMGHSGR